MNGRRFARIAITAFALSLGAASAGAAGGRTERHAAFAPPLERAPEVLSERSLARLREEGTSVLWVFFADKGHADAREFNGALRAVRGQVTERARARRAREQGGAFVPDYYDLPVPSAYVDAVRSTGARLRHVSKWLNAASVEADETAARRIASLPFVSIVTPARRSRAARPVEESAPMLGEGLALEAPRLRASLAGSSLNPPSGFGTSATQLAGVNAIAAQDSGFTGNQVIVAMFDTGYNKNHSSTVQLKRIAERDFIFGDGQTANEPADNSTQWDHGTGTWSVLGGYWAGTLVGPAYNASFVLAKTEDVRSETPVEEDYWAAAAEWADSLGVEVISSSLAYLDFDPPNVDYAYTDMNGATTVVSLAARLAARRGILVVNAMGNNGPSVGSLWGPADTDSIISVGAVDAAGNIGSFSSRGPTFDGRGKPEVVAQGVSTTWALAGNNNAVTTASGTSLSTPLVGGVAALVREAHPEWTAQQIRHALKATANRAATPDSTTYGWGRINAVLAIYGSPEGPPVYPKPFNLVAPANNSTVSGTSVNFQWGEALDPHPGDVVTYVVVLKEAVPDSIVFSAQTTSLSIASTGYLGPNKEYEWYVTARDPQLNERESRDRFRFTTSATTGVLSSAMPPAAPVAVLGQNRPNPVRFATEIPFRLEGSAAAGPVAVTLRVFDAAGRLVRTLADGPASAPVQRVVRWDGLDDSSRPVASGIYYYQLSAAGHQSTRRMVVLR